MHDYEHPYDVDDYEKNYNTTNIVNPRIGFIRKVYGILCAQLLITVLVCTAAMLTSDSSFGLFLYQRGWLVWVWFAIAIFTLIPLFCGLSEKVPANYILLLIFTLAEAMMVAQVCAIYSVHDGDIVVLMAAIMTLVITVSLTLYACVTKTDFTMKGGLIFILLPALIMFGLGAWLSGLRWFYSLYCMIGVIVYGIFLIYDTQCIIGGKRRRMSFDDYILGAVSLYLDIIGMFLYILAASGNNRSNRRH